MLNTIGAAIGWIVALTPALTMAFVMYNKNPGSEAETPAPSHASHGKAHASTGDFAFSNDKIPLHKSQDLAVSVVDHH